MNGINDNSGGTIYKNADARFWIPSENEWYKAAYYDPNKNAGAGGYWLYPTKTNVTPTAVAPPGGSNSVNYNNAVCATTDVGAYINSTSAYGTFDQGGNVAEWNDTVIGNSPYPYLFRGGAYLYVGSDMSPSAALRDLHIRAGRGNMVGFRIAAKPESDYLFWQGGNEAGRSDWTVASNWHGTNEMSGPGKIVMFGNQPVADNVVDMVSKGESVGGISFADGDNITIRSSGGYSLTLDNNGQPSPINVAGDQTISAPVVLHNDAIISGLGTLHLTEGISGPYALTLTSGTLYASSIVVDSLCVGGSTVNALPVPEPGMFILLGTSLSWLLVFRRRNRS